MQRIFYFIVPKCDYTKRDLNTASSENRPYIGTLSRMITNAIFLSHSLRKNVLIRIFVEQPFNHLYEISSKKIRYLGPELRSSASLIRKAEHYLREKKKATTKTETWFQPNPGFYASITDKIFLGFEDLISKSLVIYFSRNQAYNDHKKFTLTEFEDSLCKLTSNKEAVIFIIPLDAEHSNLSNMKDENILRVFLQNKKLDPNLIGLLNLMLDKQKP